MHVQLPNVLTLLITEVQVSDLIPYCCMWQKHAANVSCLRHRYFPTSYHPGLHFACIVVHAIRIRGKPGRH